VFLAFVTWARDLNTQAVGKGGLWGGAVLLILSAVGAWFTLLTNPTYLLALYAAIVNTQAVARGVQGATVSADNMTAIAQFAGATIAVVGAIVLALIAAWLGRPATVPDDPKPPSPG
jgi:hypothetical protein